MGDLIEYDGEDYFFYEGDWYLLIEEMGETCGEAVEHPWILH